MNLRCQLGALGALALLAQPAAAQRAERRADTLRVSIGEAVAHAITTSDESRLSRLNLAVTDAQFGAAMAPGVPQLRFQGTNTQSLKNARGDIVGSAFQQAYTFQGTFIATQTLFQGGRIFSASRAANHLRDASEFDAGETHARLAVDMQRSYINAIYFARLVELQERNLAISAERLVQVEQLASAGRSSRFDVLHARVQKANIEPLVFQARNDRENALLDLKRLLDIAMDRPIALTTTLDTGTVRAIVNSTAADLGPDDIRGTVRSAELTLLARGDAVRVARGVLMPTVSMNFNYGYLALPTQNGFPERLGATANAYCVPARPDPAKCQNNGFFADRNFGFTVNWAIFDGLLTKSNIELASAQRSIAETNLHQQREAASLDVARARAEFDRARAAWNARGQNVAEAEESFQLASLRFSRGLSTQLEVTDSQFAMLTAQSNEIRALFDVYLATAELARVRGRPIPLPTGATIPVRSSSGLTSRVSNAP
ncbi:MAG: TolC family protein [Gemmatimonadetes bacterium]|nr:TolC family protein [Gemmatimonadota bacterium]